MVDAEKSFMTDQKDNMMVDVYITLPNDMFVKTQELGLNIQVICQEAIQDVIDSNTPGIW